MISGGKCIFAEIIQSEQGTETNTAHSPHERTFLRIDTVRKNTFVTGQMQCLIFVRIVSFLEYGHIVCTAGMQICIFIGIDRINFKTDDFEIFAGNLAGLTNVFHG